MDQRENDARLDQRAREPEGWDLYRSNCAVAVEAPGEPPTAR